RQTDGGEHDRGALQSPADGVVSGRGGAVDRGSCERGCRQAIGEEPMPMIDVYATGGRFANPKALARDLAFTLMKIEQVPDIPMFRKNTAAFIHDLPDGALSNVEGDGNYVRVQVLTNAGALTREDQLAVVRKLTDLDAAAGRDTPVSSNTW